MIKIILFILCLILSPMYQILAQNGLVTAENQTANTEFVTPIQGVEWGGEFFSKITSEWSWYGGYPGFEELTEPDAIAFYTDVGAGIFFDARPEQDFRVFGKINAFYPFRFAGTEKDQESLTGGDIRIFELYSDFNIFERFYFRMGKQTIDWGAGYFFSPADMLNLTQIDPEQPATQLEGPLCLMMYFPFLMNSISCYLIADNIDRVDDVAIAPRLDLVIFDIHFGLAGFFRRGIRPKGIMLAEVTLFDIAFFGEAVTSCGTDRTIIQITDDVDYMGVKTVMRKEDWFFWATGGFKFILPHPRLLLIFQYLFNGDGLTDPDIRKQNHDGIDFLLEQGALCAEDLIFLNQHYLATSIEWQDIFSSGFGLGVFWLANLMDNSGRVKPALSWQVFEYMSIALAVPIYYGDTGDEFTPLGQGLSLCLEVSIGGGVF